MTPSCAFCGCTDGAHDIAYPHPRGSQQAQGEQSDYDAAMDRIGDCVQGLAHALGMQDVDGDDPTETIICRWLEHLTEIIKETGLKFDGDHIIPADQSGSAASSVQDEGMPPLLPELLQAFYRAYECFDDGQDYDVPQIQMQALAEYGVVRRVRGDVYETTSLGNWLYSRKPRIAS